jgi:glycerol-3-phosphate acyltransferase PlsY
MGLNPWLGVATLVTWLMIAYFFRYSSLAALISALFAPFYQLLIWGPGPTAIAAGVMGLLLIWRHSANIQKLLNGTESKLGQKSGSTPPPASPRHGAKR